MLGVSTLKRHDQGSLLCRNRELDSPQHRQIVGENNNGISLSTISSFKVEKSITSQNLVAFISHDLRHHLAGIYCNVEFMSDPTIGAADRQQLFEEVQGAVRDMTDLLDSYLLAARTGKVLQLHPSSLNALIKNTLCSFRSHPDARGIEFITSDDPSVSIRIDSQRLRTTVYNLILNACQALTSCPSPKKVGITLGHDERFIDIRVEDNGCGVPDCVRSRLFQPFVSLNKISGVGLGLSIAEQAAREHEGVLHLQESAPGKTVFVLRLPRFALDAEIIDETPRLGLKTCG